MMSDVGIVFIGGGGHALTCFDIVQNINGYQVSGYIALEKTTQSPLNGVPFLGCDDDLETVAQKHQCFHVAIGQIKSATHRVVAFERLQALQCEIVTLVSKNAYVSGLSKIGVGTLVGNSAVVCPNAKIGQNCIINNGAIIEHGAVIDDHCHIAPGAIILGDAIVGERSFIGAGAIIREGIELASESIIPAGTRVMRGDDGCTK